MVKTIVQGSGSNSTTANTTEYFRHGGHIQKSATEADMEIRWRNTGVLSNLYIRLNANSVAATSTIRTRLSGSNGSQVVSPGSNATGEFTDTTHTDTIGSATRSVVQSVPGAATGT